VNAPGVRHAVVSSALVFIRTRGGRVLTACESALFRLLGVKQLALAQVFGAQVAVDTQIVERHPGDLVEAPGTIQGGNRGVETPPFVLSAHVRSARVTVVADELAVYAFAGGGVACVHSAEQSVVAIDDRSIRTRTGKRMTGVHGANVAVIAVVPVMLTGLAGSVAPIRGAEVIVVTGQQFVVTPDIGVTTVGRAPVAVVAIHRFAHTLPGDTNFGDCAQVVIVTGRPFVDEGPDTLPEHRVAQVFAAGGVQAGVAINNGLRGRVALALKTEEYAVTQIAVVPFEAVAVTQTRLWYGFGCIVIRGCEVHRIQLVSRCIAPIPDGDFVCGGGFGEACIEPPVPALELVTDSYLFDGHDAVSPVRGAEVAPRAESAHQQATCYGPAHWASSLRNTTNSVPVLKRGNKGKTLFGDFRLHPAIMFKRHQRQAEGEAR